MLVLSVLATVAVATACIWRKVIVPLARVLELHDELVEVEAIPANAEVAKVEPGGGSFETDLSNLIGAVGSGHVAFGGEPVQDSYGMQGTSKEGADQRGTARDFCPQRTNTS